jgi:hypothetical protein
VLGLVGGHDRDDECEGGVEPWAGHRGHVYLTDPARRPWTK